MEWIKGDLLEADLDYYCHQVNCQGKMGSGIAKSIREKWPIVYKEYCDWHMGYEAWAHAHQNQEYTYNAADAMLGHIQVVKVNDNQNVVNMAAQAYFGYDGRRYTSYDAFWSCLGEIKATIPKGSKIGFPKNIGCGLGGANWQVIETMIYEVLDNDYKVYIYELEK